MSVYERLPPERQRRLDQAAAWASRLRDDPSLELTPEFMSWISERENEQALGAVDQTLSALADFGATPLILDMRRAALTRLRNAGVRRWLPRRMVAQAAAAAVILITAVGLAWYLTYAGPQVYSTTAGERRTVTLPDQSHIVLDSDSLVKVFYGKSIRAVVLRRGRARFDVAHDRTRPFTVTAGDETVVAVGTSFDVERLGRKVVVTLIQGRVLIQRADTSFGSLYRAPTMRSVSLSAGQELTAIGGAKPIVSPADVEAATAWESGHIVFRGVPLSEAVVRVNRYTDHPMSVDASAASIRISGVFNAGDTGAFLGAITSYFPVEATISGDNRVVLRRRSD